MFPPLFVVKITAPIHARGCDAGAEWEYTYFYICADIGRRKLRRVLSSCAWILLPPYTKMAKKRLCQNVG